LDWYAKTSDVSLNVGLLAWKHRNDAGGCIISVETFKHPSLSGAPAGTPHLKAVPQSQLIQRFPDQSVTSYTADFEPDVRYMVHIKLDHAGTETWPAITYTLRYWEEPAVMEFQLLDSECDRAKTFREKVAAESALQEYKLAHVGLVTTLQSADRVIDWVGKLGHRLLQDGRGCFRNITGTLEQHRIKPINNTLGLIRGQDPNVPTRLVVEAADGEIYGVSEANFEFMRMGSRRVTFHGLIGAAHLNGKGGTLVRLKPGSLDRVVVRLDDDGEEVAVKFANYRGVCRSIGGQTPLCPMRGAVFYSMCALIGDIGLQGRKKSCVIPPR